MKGNKPNRTGQKEIKNPNQIDEDFSYRENSEEQILCDKCYKHYKVI